MVWRRRPRDAGCWPHRPICCAQDKRDPVAVPLPWLRAPGGSCGEAPSCGRDRRYRPDRPLSRVLHLHQACMDHPLEVARQRLQVDGKPHPTAPSHPQAPKPVGALQLGVRSLDTSPYVIPLAPLLGDLGPPATMFGWHPASHHVVPAKWTSTRSQLVLLGRRVAGGAHRGLNAGRVPRRRPRPEGSPVPFPGARLRSDPTAKSSFGPSAPEPVNDRHCSRRRRGGHLHVGDELGGVKRTSVERLFSRMKECRRLTRLRHRGQVSATCTSYPFPLWPL